ncbi:MAG: STN domain-containing protein, partial [Anaerolineales bacterium]
MSRFWRYGLLALSLSGMVGTVRAQGPTLALDLPAQSLSATLDAIAKTSGLKLLYADEAVRGRESPPLKGNYTVAEALHRVLAGSGLRYEFVSENMIAANDPRSGTAPPPEKNAPKATAAKDKDRTVLEEITVTGQPVGET